MAKKPFFKHLPDWMYDDPQYVALGAGPRLLLHLISGQCDQHVDSGSRRGCKAVSLLKETSGIKSKSAFTNNMNKLRDAGFVVKVGQGAGRGNANEYAVPGVRGALDHLDVGDDDRFKTQPNKQEGYPNDTLKEVVRRAGDSKPAHSMPDTHVSEKGVGPPIKGYGPVEEKVPNPTRKGVETTPPYSHHQEDIPLSHKRPPEELPLNGQPAVCDETPGRADSSLDDDHAQAMRLELPDDASEHQAARALRDRGVDIRRANTIASKVKPALIREAILRCNGYQPENPGAYLAEVIEGLVDKEKTARAEGAAQKIQQRAALLDDYTRQIENMDDGEVMALFHRHCERTSWPTAGFTPNLLRSKLFHREMLAKQMLHENAVDD